MDDVELGQRAAVDPLFADASFLAVAEDDVEQLPHQALRLWHLATTEHLIGRANRLIATPEAPQRRLPGEQPRQLLRHDTVVAGVGERTVGLGGGEDAFEEVAVGGEEEMAVGDRHGRVRKELLLPIAEPSPMPLGFRISLGIGMGRHEAGGLDLHLRDRIGAVDELPDDVAVELHLPHVRVGRHRLGHRLCHLLRIVRLDGDHEALAVDVDRHGVVADDRHPGAEAADEVVLDVDLGAVRILFERRDHILEHTLFTDDIIDERLGRGERCLHVPLHRHPARHVARNPRRGIEPGGVGELEHAGGEFVAVGGKGLPPLERRGMDEGVVAEIVEPVVEHDHPADGLHRVEALATEDRHVVGALALLAGRIGGLNSPGEAERIDVPADRRRGRRNLVGAPVAHRLVGRDRGEPIGPPRKRRRGLHDDGGIVADDERIGTKNDGDARGKRGPRFLRHVVDRHRGAVARRRGRLRGLPFGEALTDRLDQSRRLVTVAGGIDEDHRGQLAGGRLDDTEGDLASRNAREILEREPELPQTLPTGFAGLIPDALHEGKHLRVPEQLPVVGVVEAFLEPAGIRGADPDPRGRREDRLARGKPGGLHPEGRADGGDGHHPDSGAT